MNANATTIAGLCIAVLVSTAVLIVVAFRQARNAPGCATLTMFLAAALATAAVAILRALPLP